VMNNCSTKSALSQARQQLVQLMQRLNFGRIEGLVIRNGEPVLTPPPRVLQEIKFGGENGPRPEACASDFLLKIQVIELFQQFDRVGNATIEVLEIKHGLPFRMNVMQASG
jgi:hypothetical protein